MAESRRRAWQGRAWWERDVAVERVALEAEGGKVARVSCSDSGRGGEGGSGGPGEEGGDVGGGPDKQGLGGGGRLVGPAEGWRGGQPASSEREYSVMCSTNTVSATGCPGKFRLSSLPLGQSPPTP
uniref:Uncharacterized protein n=1 Tax=Oryza rufipogon TaxID=4529 RepID=A0A0E0PYY7_ORYRU